jgi:hypothetical protein
MKKLLIIGSHGLHGKYGGWDQLVNNIAEQNKRFELYIVNPKDNPFTGTAPEFTRVINSQISGTGIKGLFLDWFYTLKMARVVDCFLLLGAKSIPSAIVAKLLFKNKIVVNVGGIEWERPQYNKLLKMYLRFCFDLSLKFADEVILDNKHYLTFCDDSKKPNIKIIPYGGTIDTSLSREDYLQKYPFLGTDYYLSISRAIKDNHIEEICEAFAKSTLPLVLISNFSSSSHGVEVLERFKTVENLTLIDGLYDKAELDLVRRECKAYVHTHTLCGSAPSLIEMIRAKKFVFSIDVPQNRFTLGDEGAFFSDFKGLVSLIEKTDFQSDYVHPLFDSYDWDYIVSSYLDACE